MAQNKNSRKCEGLCHKIHNAVSVFRSTARRISHHPQGLVSVASSQKPQSHITENPSRISSVQTKRGHFLHQPSLSKMIPVELEPFSAGKEKSDSEIMIVRGQKLANSPSRKKECSPQEKFSPTEDEPHNHVQFAKATSKKDCYLLHEGKFSDYISKVKSRMMKTTSDVGGGGGGGAGISTRRDSFNDRVTNYINHTQIKIRTTADIGVEKSHSLK